MKFNTLFNLPLLGLVLFFSIFLVAASSIARTCMTSGDKCQRWGNEGFINATIGLGVVGIVLAMIGIFFFFKRKSPAEEPVTKTQ